MSVTTNKTLGIVITDGVGYRNFVLSNFLNQASKQFKKVFIYSGLPIHVYNEQNHFNNVSIIELPLYKETRKVWFFRKLKELSHMHKHRDFFGINNNLKRVYPKTNSGRALLTKLAYLISSVFHSEKNIHFFENKQFNSFKNSKEFSGYTNILKTNTPDIIFFTHQRPPFLAPFLVAAKDLGIKTSTFIFSWDNLASKGRMLAEFDNYLVWSNLMKDELEHFYPNTDSNNIAVVGTPQFEPYVMDKYQTNKDAFFTKFNLDANKKNICYSCADAGIGANDEVHIRSVYKYITSNPDKNLQLLVRTSPAEDGKRFFKLKTEYPDIKWNFPKWTLTRKDHVETWSQRIPSVEDVLDLKSVLQFCDLNINMCSTMGLDFMIFDKPVINTVFGNENNGLYNDQIFLNYVHYKYVIDSKAVTIAKDEQELHQQITEAIDKPELRQTYRKQLLQLEIGKDLIGTSERIVEALSKF